MTIAGGRSFPPSPALSTDQKELRADPELVLEAVKRRWTLLVKCWVKCLVNVDIFGFCLSLFDGIEGHSCIFWLVSGSMWRNVISPYTPLKIIPWSFLEAFFTL